MCGSRNGVIQIGDFWRFFTQKSPKDSCIQSVLGQRRPLNREKSRLVSAERGYYTLWGFAGSLQKGIPNKFQENLPL